MINLIRYLDSFFGYPPLLLFVIILSTTLKIYILVKLFFRKPKTTTINKYPWIFLITVLVSSIVCGFAWILSLVRILWFSSLGSYRSYLFLIRFSWAMFAVQYQALALFIESLIEKSTNLKFRQKICIVISSLFLLGITSFAFLNFDTLTRTHLEFITRSIEGYYLVFLVMMPTLLYVLWRLRDINLPLILKKQLKILIPALIIPMWALDILHIFPLVFSPNWTTNSYSAVNLSTILITYCLFYCARKVSSLRFLNAKGQIQSTIGFNFIDGFKNVLEQLSHATNVAELRHITQTLFKDSFGIPFNKTNLFIRNIQDAEKNTQNQATMGDNRNTILVENFLNTQPIEIINYISTSKIFIYDEIAFSNFYEKNTANQTILTFLETLEADIFLPILEKQKIIAYILVERHSRPNKFYDNIEHDEMLVFASYLANIINLLQTRNLTMLIQQEKDLKEELYHKHQEINQYKESIRSFLRNTQQKEIGIVFYKNRHFTFGNKAAKEFIHINLNTQEGHPLTKALKQVAQQVEEYKMPYTHFAHDKDGNKLVLAGVPHLEKNNIIITIYHPEISDIIKRQIDLLQDPSKWDYLLYLETTASGKLINQLIPSSSEKLLNFKISLLKMALSKKALLLEMTEEDLIPTVEIIHHISLRETLHIIKLHNLSRNNDIAIKLFGINPLFSLNSSIKPILEQLNGTGMLFIQNIHFLDLETQEYLAEFIRYGFYRIFKSDQKITSNVRIICSTNQNLNAMVQEGTFSKMLFNELRNTTLSMPSLLTLSEEELSLLADGFIEQALKTNDLKNILALSEKEKMKLAHKRPVSLQEFKEKIQQILVGKSKKNNIYNETQFDPAYQLSDPQLIEAARLGKHALRDQRIMIMLWDKFKSQTKIATFLGVNRSSVNRRCKEFKLES